MFDRDVPSIVDAPVGRHEYSEMLVAGGFPEARMRSPAARMRFFASYVGSIVDRDIADVARVQDPTAVGTLLGLVVARSGALARYETLARDAAWTGRP